MGKEMKRGLGGESGNNKNAEAVRVESGGTEPGVG